MKKLAVVALYKNSSIFYKKELELLFGDCLEIESYYIEDQNFKNKIDADLILLTSHIIIRDVKKIINKDVEAIIMKRTFIKEGFNKLTELEPNQKVMLVSSFYELAVEAIAKIYELGIKQINFVPVYPGMEQIPDIDIAVTPGEVDSVPGNVKKIIDLKNRVIDLSTVMDIIYKLNIDQIKAQQIINTYKTKIIHSTDSMSVILEKSNELQKQLDVILSFTHEGIIAINTGGLITECNNAAEKLFNIKRSKIINKKVGIELSYLQLDKVLKNGIKKENNLINLHGKNIVCSNYPIKLNDRLLGAVALVKEFLEMENTNQEFRKKIIKNGYTARYTFDDIVGIGNSIVEIKKIARKMANSDSTILITGESGTGKELFAHAIHNASSRKNGPFVALNCSTLTENLLEAELFGYEPGAFTGARKSGKQGLFELSHNGTIFLDEISELPLNLQAKLLRVLMEKEIMRVGGTDLITIDTKVIAASNKKLRELVAHKKFREDLYYRLNVFPLEIPPLRERKSDIRILINSFLEKESRDIEIPEKVIRILEKLDWRGNVRELKNCLTYLFNISEGEISEKDLPKYILRQISSNSSTSIKQETFNSKGKFSQGELFILNQLKISLFKEKNIGRRRIYEKANEAGLKISEQSIRTMLKQFEKMGLVKIYQGRKGTRITELGLKKIDEQVPDNN